MKYIKDIKDEKEIIQNVKRVAKHLQGRRGMTQRSIEVFSEK